MTDIECPYCGAGQEICHDDGYGYDEDKEYEQECRSCYKTFKFTTCITLSYSAYCDGDHDLVYVESHPGLVECSRDSCEYFARESAKNNGNDEY